MLSDPIAFRYFRPRLRPLMRAAALLAALGFSAWAQTRPSQPPPALSFRYAPAPRDSARLILIVRVEIAPGWHINSDAPLDEFLVPTTLEAHAEGVEFGKPKFPPPERVRSEVMGGDMLLFSGAFDIEVPIRAQPAAKRGSKPPMPRTRVTLRYQACDHATCFPPKDVSVEG